MTGAFGAGGSATIEGSLNRTKSGSLIFTPGQTSKTIQVIIQGDNAVEPDEHFFVNLSSPTNATIADGQGQGNIQNDD
jgi:Calx-beta domain